MKRNENVISRINELIPIDGMRRICIIFRIEGKRKRLQFQYQRNKHHMLNKLKRTINDFRTVSQPQICETIHKIIAVNQDKITYSQTTSIYSKNTICEGNFYLHLKNQMPLKPFHNSIDLRRQKTINRIPTDIISQNQFSLYYPNYKT